MKKQVVSLLLIGLLLFPLTGTLAQDDSIVAITNWSLNAYSEPDGGSDVLKVLETREAYPIVGKNRAETWWLVEYEPGKLGWILAKDTEVWGGNIANVPVVESNTATAPAAANPAAPASTGLTASPTVWLLNVRQLPSTAAPILGTLETGQTAPILGRNAANTWWLVQDDEAVGWIANRFAIPQGGDINTVPVTDQAGYLGGGPAVQTQAPTTTTTTTTSSQAPVVASSSGDIVAYGLMYPQEVRQLPDSNSPALVTIPPDRPYPILGKSADGLWWLIDYGSGTGWINALWARYEFQNGRSLTSVPVTDQAGTGIAQASAAPVQAQSPTDAIPLNTGLSPVPGTVAIPQWDLNVRNQASVEGDILATLPVNARVPIVGRTSNSNWWLVEYAPGQQGWIASGYARYEYDETGVPIDRVPVIQ